MKQMNILNLIILLPIVESFCELEWTNRSDILKPGELMNAITSLSYTLLGIIGIITNNHSCVYYLLMNLFILTGISSFLHHYYYAIGSWSHVIDITSMYLLSVFSLFYIVCDNEYNINKYIKRGCNFLITTTSVSFITTFHLGYHQERSLLFKLTLGEIIFTQMLLCSYYIYINSHIKKRVIVSSLWNLLLFLIGIIMWYIDDSCEEWVYINHFNGHSIWHIAISWSLFNTINITNLCRYEYNRINIIWKPLCSVIPGFLYLILITKEKSNMKHNYTDIKLEEIKLLSPNENNHHRRVNTIG